ncbi:DUF2797 domain-containing protein [Elizabethkingia argentiflava]|uniref:DUF2797 domain-containing protein n=1 Tax=Elizabethkingia argenteiflava TaxID=2681556 RepID=A0A845PYB5_9FLAO|nr:DUF2797 domain-containing protein [Elizabethkingia argenteiflava]NAW52273.1 DUF2797 domain-containing protein [Elizabethkingia argenteiflava]
MKFSGQILKMISDHTKPIRYYLNLSEDLICMNQLFNQELSFQHIGYQCVSCGNDEPVYRMGFCKKCFFKSPYASDTILRPELSTAHLGIEERDLAVEKEIQLVPHIVYLAYTGEVKVGVTRESQIPTRWIDQGATLALPIARTRNRYEAGVIEVEIKKHITDKTQWKKMLQTQEKDIDIISIRDSIKSYLPKDYEQFYSSDEEVWKMEFPYEVPMNIEAFSLNKKSEFTGILKGIKGQYLCFEGGQVINIRGHEGYVINLSVS